MTLNWVASTSIWKRVTFMIINPSPCFFRMACVFYSVSAIRVIKKMSLFFIYRLVKSANGRVWSCFARNKLIRPSTRTDYLLAVDTTSLPLWSLNLEQSCASALPKEHNSYYSAIQYLQLTYPCPYPSASNTIIN